MGDMCRQLDGIERTLGRLESNDRSVFKMLNKLTAVLDKHIDDTKNDVANVKDYARSLNETSSRESKAALLQWTGDIDDTIQNVRDTSAGKWVEVRVKVVINTILSIIVGVTILVLGAFLVSKITNTNTSVVKEEISNGK